MLFVLSTLVRGVLLSLSATAAAVATTVAGTGGGWGVVACAAN